MAADLVLWNAAPQGTFGADDTADGAPETLGRG